MSTMKEWKNDNLDVRKGKNKKKEDQRIEGIWRKNRVIR